MEFKLRALAMVLLITFIYLSVFMFVQFILSYVICIFFFKNTISIILTILILKPFNLEGE